MPSMLTKEGLPSVLAMNRHVAVLDQVCLQCEPDSSDYIRVRVHYVCVVRDLLLKISRYQKSMVTMVTVDKLMKMFLQCHPYEYEYSTVFGLDFTVDRSTVTSMRTLLRSLPTTPFAPRSTLEDWSGI